MKSRLFMQKSILLITWFIWALFGTMGLDAQPVSRLSILTDSATFELKNQHDVRVTHLNDSYIVEFNIRDGKEIGFRHMRFNTKRQFEYATYQWKSGRTVVLDFSGQSPDEKFNLKLIGHKKCGQTMVFDPNELTQ